jgi:RNA polymerase sigma-70 factor, ECF subfamily
VGSSGHRRGGDHPAPSARVGPAGAVPGRGRDLGGALRGGNRRATDWKQIAELYALLERIRPGPGARISRAFAISRIEGPEAGLALLDDIADDEPYLALVRGVLHGEAGRPDDAIAELEKARTHARNSHEEAQIADLIERLRRGRS